MELLGDNCYYKLIDIDQKKNTLLAFLLCNTKQVHRFMAEHK